MPSTAELQDRGRNDLACVISRRGGFRSWASVLGVQLKGTETHRAMEVEDMVESKLVGAGFKVQRQTTRAPYDLLVNGHRVDVKSARPGVYGKGRGHRHRYVGWMFHLAKVPATCDHYFLVCQDKDGEVVRSYVVPADEARVTMLTITPDGKYERFRDALDLLT